MNPKSNENNDVIIFGAGENAQLALYYFENDSDKHVRGFVVDDEFKKSDSFCDLPLVGMSEVESKFPATRHGAFVAVGYTRMNELRQTSYENLKAKGYAMASYISSRCNNFAMEVGENAFILEDNTIQPFVRVGHNVVLWSGNHIGHHSQIGAHCFITSHVVVSGGVMIGENCFFGVNATVRDHIEIGDRTMVGAGAIVTKSSAEDTVWRAAKSEIKDFTSDQLKRI